MLARVHAGEANTLVSILTPDLGLVRARAQSLRKSGAKLSSALATFAESSLVLVRGKEEWRIAGAVLERNRFFELKNADARESAGRVAGLLLRLIPGEEGNPALFAVLAGFFDVLADPLASELELVRSTAEALVVLRILAALGLDSGTIPGEPDDFSDSILAAIESDRAGYIARINRGIAASGL